MVIHASIMIIQRSLHKALKGQDLGCLVKEHMETCNQVNEILLIFLRGWYTPVIPGQMLLHLFIRFISLCVCVYKMLFICNFKLNQ